MAPGWHRRTLSGFDGERKLWRILDYLKSQDDPAQAIISNILYLEFQGTWPLSVRKFMGPPEKPREPESILQDFIGRKCFSCGRPKYSRESFCIVCYRKLPPDVKSGLWKRFGEGYEVNFRRALAFLGKSQ